MVGEVCLERERGRDAVRQNNMLRELSMHLRKIIHKRICGDERRNYALRGEGGGMTAGSIDQHESVQHREHEWVEGRGLGAEEGWVRDDTEEKKRGGFGMGIEGICRTRCQIRQLNLCGDFLEGTERQPPTKGVQRMFRLRKECSECFRLV